ncbi:MAG: ABC transporter ATP-binding protein [Thermogemmatispora sp.]|uniref:ABC transporter ATP-binding protein n=1 Tax=Thermogemmatispora aurantia TaxID=2045279 RepID=A0A5J4KAU9_9CHLR|nr:MULTISPECIES: ABC transporter ATP-binding protein [Thermogemmatispora]MBE3565387.1 ABC transporter ATP-binding protein [Thermogemmatispora sp.]GER83847.1 ABC transporter ATP-binding protein [Thermogemmatispora aurantia]
MSGNSAAIISIENVHKSYGSLKALDGVTLHIGNGECFGLLGPNGAGKTTLLSCIEGLISFQEGRITVSGYDVARQPRKVKSLLGVQLQDETLFTDLKAVEAVQFYGALYNTFPTRAEALALLERFDLAEKSNARIGTLSGGQQKRLTLALAMVHQPSVILLDEPTTGLDPQARHHIWDSVRRLRSEGKTIILTTHYIEEAEVLCDRVGIIDQGKILALGTPRELIERMGNLSTVRASLYLPAEKLQQLQTAEFVHTVSGDDGLLTVQTSDPQRVLALLEEIGQELGSRPQNVSIRQPNLEDVFLSLTGRSIGPAD